MEENEQQKPGLVVDYNAQFNEEWQNLPTPRPYKKSPITKILLLLLFCLVAGAFIYWRKTPESAKTVPDVAVQEEEIVTPEEQVVTPEEEEAKEEVQLSPERVEKLLTHEQYPTVYNRYKEEWTPPVLSPPDSITTKYGAIHVGEITAYDEDGITIKTANGISLFKMKDLRYYTKIKFSAKEYARYMALEMLDHTTTHGQEQPPF